MHENAEQLLEPLVWQTVLGPGYDARSIRQPAVATELREHAPRVNAQVKERAQQVRGELPSPTLAPRLIIAPNGELAVEQSSALEVLFQTYRPAELGIIEYHSALRAYEREQLGGINLNLDSYEEQRRQQMLYNWREKYRNVKSELASTYVRSVISEKATEAAPDSDLNATLRDLFQTFFPDKTYEGPRPEPDGSLTFPV